MGAPSRVKVPPENRRQPLSGPDPVTGKPRPGRPATKPRNPDGKRGRPSIYSDDLARRICGAVAQGMSIQKACDTFPGVFPSAWVVYQWITENKSDYFTQLYRRARAVADEGIADTLLDIADEPLPMIRTTRRMKDGSELIEERADAAAAARQKIRLASRQWWLSKRRPEVYGDFVHLYHKHEQAVKVEVSLQAPEWLQGLIGPRIDPGVTLALPPQDVTEESPMPAKNLPDQTT